jgi:hypothetical protein
MMTWGRARRIICLAAVQSADSPTTIRLQECGLGPLAIGLAHELVERNEPTDEEPA